VDRLRGRKSTREDVLAVGDLLDELQTLPADARPSEISEVCVKYEPRVLLAARVVLGEEPFGAMLDRYYGEWRFVKSDLTGEDLRAMGLDPGPQFALLLDQLLAARLDGRVGDEDSERALLADLLRETTENDDS